jgi:predicted lipoprotein
MNATTPTGPAGVTARAQRPARGLLAAIVAIGVFLVLAVLFGFTVVSTEDDAALNVEFDPVTFVDQNWDAIRAAISDNAVPLADVLDRIQPDEAGKAAVEDLTPVAEALGLITTGEAHVYRVTATGTVTDADTETSRGTIGIDVDGYDGPIAVRVYVGSRIPSDESSIRDGTGIIEFGDFRDQTEYGKVASEINKRVLAGLEGLDVASLVGQPVTLTGAFTLRTFNQPAVDVSQIVLVPLSIEPA